MNITLITNEQACSRKKVANCTLRSPWMICRWCR